MNLESLRSQLPFLVHYLYLIHAICTEVRHGHSDAVPPYYLVGRVGHKGREDVGGGVIVVTLGHRGHCEGGEGRGSVDMD